MRRCVTPTTSAARSVLGDTSTAATSNQGKLPKSDPGKTDVSYVPNRAARTRRTSSCCQYGASNADCLVDVVMFDDALGCDGRATRRCRYEWVCLNCATFDHRRTPSRGEDRHRDREPQRTGDHQDDTHGLYRNATYCRVHRKRKDCTYCNKEHRHADAHEKPLKPEEKRALVDLRGTPDFRARNETPLWRRRLRKPKFPAAHQEGGLARTCWWA